jgi:two-component system sensor kinase FixL
MRIVLGNLVRNARDAMSAGGRLTLTARSIDQQVEVLVADTGAGMEAAVLSRITEPLYSTKARGLGLGLAISRAILDKHGARMTVQSAPGQGATFSVLLRAAGTNAEESGK